MKKIFIFGTTILVCVVLGFASQFHWKSCAEQVLIADTTAGFNTDAAAKSLREIERSIRDVEKRNDKEYITECCKIFRKSYPYPKVFEDRYNAYSEHLASNVADCSSGVLTLLHISQLQGLLGPYVIRLPGHVVFGLASEPNMWMESETCTWHSRTDIWTRYPTKPESILSKAFGELYARDRILAIYYARLGNRLLKLGKHTEGKRYLWNSTRPDAWDISGISSLADVLVKSKLEQEVKEGIRLLAWSISLNTTPEENEALAKLYISQKKWSEARDLLTKAVSCFPANESLKELKKIACKQAKC